jgi:ABC-type transport system involved in cytochrome c biogenesis permease subunit
MRSSRAARAAVLLGVLAVLAIPVGVAAAQASRLRLLETLYVVVPVALVLGLSALASSRRARFAAARSVVPRGRLGLRGARVVAWGGLYAGVTGGLALAVYGVLRWAQ